MLLHVPASSRTIARGICSCTVIVRARRSGFATVGSQRLPVTDAGSEAWLFGWGRLCGL
ncbi:hypothetical protein M3J09_006789 [Ascochyta lentis]